jgi:hypothetical protein
MGKILLICLAHENQEMCPETHSGKLSKNEIQVAFGSEHSLH